MIKKILIFICGIIIGVSLAFNPILSEAADKIKILVNGIDKTPSQGVIIQNGTTYLPIRWVAQTLNIPIEWNGKTRSVLIGDTKGNNVLLSNLNPKTSNDSTANRKITVNNQAYNSNIAIGAGNQGFITYDLNGKYKELSFKTAIKDKYDDDNGKYASHVIITGDEGVLWESDVLAGVSPQEFTVDVTGVLKLKIESKKGGFFEDVVLLDPVLK